MKDLRLIVKAKASAMARWREERKLNQREAANLAGVSPSNWGYLENLKESPKTKSGDWRIAALRIAAAMRCLPEDIWTPAVLQVRFPEIVADVDAGSLQLSLAEEARDRLALPSPHDHVVAIDVRRALSAAIETLTKQEQQVILGRYWRDQTFAQIAGDLDLSCERVRQIEAKALRKLRHDDRATPIKEAQQ